MAIALDVTSLAEITSYNGLTGAVEMWLDRDDLITRVPYFIALAEAEFRRMITRTERETTVDLPGALPSDFDSVKSIYITDEPGWALRQVSPTIFRERYSSTQWTGSPTVFCLTDAQILTGPLADRTYSGKLTYNRRIPSLTVANQTNWLLVDHPDLYLLGTLQQAEFYGWNDDRLPLLADKIATIIEQVNMAGNRRRHGSGPLVPVSPVQEGLGRRW